MRVAKAQSELVKFNAQLEAVHGELESSDDAEFFAEKLRAKYDIPEGVHLFGTGDEGVLEKHNACTCKPHIAAFVRGTLTEDSLYDLIFYFEEVDECDYGWILVERPMGFYGRPSDESIEEITAEIVSIGTRSRSKNTNLPRICGMFFSDKS